MRSGKSASTEASRYAPTNSSERPQRRAGRDPSRGTPRPTRRRRNAVRSLNSTQSIIVIVSPASETCSQRKSPWPSHTRPPSARRLSRLQRDSIVRWAKRSISSRSRRRYCVRAIARALPGFRASAAISPPPPHTSMPYRRQPRDGRRRAATRWRESGRRSLCRRPPSDRASRTPPSDAS